MIKNNDLKLESDKNIMTIRESTVEFNTIVKTKNSFEILYEIKSHLKRN